MKKSKKIIIILSAFLVLIICALAGVLVFYNNSLKAVGGDTPVEFTVSNGESVKTIISNLKEKGLIKNEKTAYFYYVTNKVDSLKAGLYPLNKNQSVKEIFETLSGSNNAIEESFEVMFIPGNRMDYYIERIAAFFHYSEEEVEAKLSDQEFLNRMIKRYWFLTDEILNDKLYYALEGYLYPDTYRFKKDATIEDVLIKLLDETAIKLDPYKEQILNSGYSVHEILTMASIIQKEAKIYDDKTKVSQVIYKRLDMGMSLGMDVTAYYGGKIPMDKTHTNEGLASLTLNNPYNTRVITGLPVGPICGVTVEDVKAALNPSDTFYVYFVADVKTGKVYFAETYNEFLQLNNKYNKEGY